MILRQERIKRVNKIDYLVVSSSYDYSTDLVCCRLAEREAQYYRLNRDEFKKHELLMDLQRQVLLIRIDELEFLAEFDSLKGIYFRAPVFLRTQSKKILPLDEQLEKNQWSAFIRNLVVFQSAVWINSPVDIYRAENKMLQLCFARKCGLEIPKTCLTNTQKAIFDSKKYVVKSLDTALFYDYENEKEMFTYSNLISSDDLKGSYLEQAPVIIQEALDPKIDCRITYIDGKMFPVQILLGADGLHGDWRYKKEGLIYKSFDLPENIKTNLKLLMQSLNLKFGGIDLAIYKNRYYFIEVNPIGEWGWLETVANLEISNEICNRLMR